VTFLLAQLSDPHLGAAWDGPDPSARFAQTLEAMAAVRPRPDALILTGDLAEHASESEYTEVRDGLATLGIPFHVLSGNQDCAAPLRSAFGLPGADDEPLQYALELGPLRLIALDTTRAGADEGEFGATRREWLTAELASARDKRVVVAMHHPPLVTGIPVFDSLGLPAADREALAQVLAAHPRVELVIAGHLHRPMTGEFGGTRVCVCPSTFVQFRFDLDATSFALSDEPSGFALHAFDEDRVISHVLLVT
jgi:3',5'-cyclic AMP phosphodiesterase CpdA